MLRKKSRKGNKANGNKSVLEQLKSSADADCTPKMMRCGYYALKDGDWVNTKRICKVEASATERAFKRVREVVKRWQKMKREAGTLYKELY